MNVTRGEGKGGDLSLLLVWGKHGRVSWIITRGWKILILKNFLLLFSLIAHPVVCNMYGNSSELRATAAGYGKVWHSGLVCSYCCSTDPPRIYLYNRELTDYPIFLLWDK